MQQAKATVAGTSSNSCGAGTGSGRRKSWRALGTGLLLVSLVCVHRPGAADSCNSRRPGKTNANSTRAGVAPDTNDETARAGDRSRLMLELLFEDNLADHSPSHRQCKAQGTIAFVEGRQGRGVSFDGRSWIDTGLSQDELGQEITVECWVNPGPAQRPHADIFGNHVSQGRGFVLQQEGSNTNQFLAGYGRGDGQWVLSDAVPLTAGRWQHVALVKTRQELRLYLNGVLVASKESAAPMLPSPMPVAVGLGYSDQNRCFRGLIDDFRVWNQALDDFAHAGIDAGDAEEIRAQFLSAAPRVAAEQMVRSWTLATDDTRLTIGVTATGKTVMSELSCPAIGSNWLASPVATGFWSHAGVAGKRRRLRWQFIDAAVDDGDGRKLTLQFACKDPALEVTSCWHARPGPGPIHYNSRLTNRSGGPVTVGEQPTFDVDLTGASDMWSFHSDGGTPDPVGVYRQTLTDDKAGQRYTLRTTPSGAFIPYVVLDAKRQHGIYLGLEWSFCRFETLTLASSPLPSVRVRGGNLFDMHAKLAPGATLQVRPGFVGTYRGDLDDAGNRLRRWLFRYCVPEVLRRDPSYPKVQWNAFGATGKTPGSWDPVEKRYYPLIDDIAPLGFEEVMIDVGWWQGGEPDSDRVDWSSGMKKAADYAHDKGLRFGLYWTDNVDMASPAGREQRAERIRRLFREYDADMWRSDCTRGAVIGASYAATCGFYELVDALAREIPQFQWENCCGGGRIKDYGAMRRAVKIFNSDTYSPLHVRQAFYDSSYAFPPAQLEGHLGSINGRYRPQGVSGIRYAFRSTSMGAPEWFLDAPGGGNGCEPWTVPEREALKACVATYKEKIRPLVRRGDLYHILPRPDGREWDGIEYYDPAAGKGVVYLFKPGSGAATKAIRLKGLDTTQDYRVRFEDRTQRPSVKSAAELLGNGLELTLKGPEASELIFFEIAR